MRSTQAAISARMSSSGRRIMTHPRRDNQASLRASLPRCFSLPCQYLPSASTAIMQSGRATSTTYWPMRYSASNAIERAISSLWSARSRLLVRGHVDATNAPEQRREQNRKRETSDGLTLTSLPHISHVISGFDLNKGCSGPLRRRLDSSAHGLEQNFACDRFGWTVNVLPHTPHVNSTGDLTFHGRSPISVFTRRAFAKLFDDLGFGTPRCVALMEHGREQYFPRPFFIRALVVENTVPQFWQVRSIMRQLYRTTAYASINQEEVP